MAPEEPDAAEINVIGRCLDRLILNLKSDYEKIIRAVDIEQRSIAAVTNELQISTNNVNVRLHRARQQLRARLEETCKLCARHGCLDCSCDSSG